MQLSFQNVTKGYGRSIQDFVHYYECRMCILINSQLESFRVIIVQTKLYLWRINSNILELHRSLHWKKLGRFTMWTSRKFLKCTITIVHKWGTRFWECQYHRNIKLKAWLLLHLFRLFLLAWLKQASVS